MKYTGRRGDDSAGRGLGSQNVLLFMLSFDTWSGTVVIRPESAKAVRSNSWKVSMGSEVICAPPCILP
jgi:hypothetical protein